ncbi:glycosyltransferase [Luteimonas sp. R10]|uniref:glycosyltransferase n=1 Tax=Luteimonas sp. R10 TaxID=3108176 RepID=UPI00308A3D0A|nr:glycosyltransferase [Luteimonas sp. R10]
MERLNQQMAFALERSAELVVIGPAGCRAHLPAGSAVHEVPIASLSVFLFQSMALARKLAKGHFDLIIAGSGLTVPAAVLAARRTRAKSMAYLHGLDIVATHLAYRALWLPALRRLDGALANSANTADLAIREGLAHGNVAVVHPGTTLPDREVIDAGDFRARFGLGDSPIILSVGRLTERKGLAEFVEQALPAIVAKHPQVRLVLVGDNAPDALRKHAIDPGASLAKAAAAHGLSHHVVRLGPCDEVTLGQAYAAADVHVFPVRQVAGDVEGFGMVAIEAAAHGLPTVAFAVGGVPDAVRDGISGYMLAPGDYTGFADRVSGILAERAGTLLRDSAHDFALSFSWDRFSERLHECLQMTAYGRRFDPVGHRGHAVLDLESRSAKARKIERLLELRSRERRLRLLEIGTGSGGVAHYFGSHPRIDFDVDAVDVTDTRQVHGGYRFTKTSGTQLPFADAVFDVVITNHVIEHVGDAAAQRHHLEEVKRVLAPSGRAYLAVPNRWMLIEPHYRLAFLSWLPESWRTSYLRWRQRGTEYDCRPLTTAQAEALLEDVGFEYEQMHGSALRLTYELERPQALVYRVVFRRIPDRVFHLARRAFPTLIYVLSASDPDRSARAVPAK